MVYASLERVCVHCGEIFYPIEGNETRDFCSDDCEGAHQEGLPGVGDTAAEIYRQDYGTEPPWLT